MNDIKSNKANYWPMLAFAALPYFILLATAYMMFAITVDDPFITFRYAANLLAGHGPVFNVGERVEADSSPDSSLFERELRYFRCQRSGNIFILFCCNHDSGVVC